MKTIASVFGVFALSLVLSAVPSGRLGAAYAKSEQGHCHNKGPAGQLVEADDLDTQLACDEEGGTWFRQPQHCHKLGPDGRVIELISIPNQKACVAKNGQWMDHTQAK